MAYPGGKNGAGVYQKIINHLPPHSTYIEPFLGSGAIMRLKRPALASIGIDSDASVINSFVSGTIPGLTLIHADALAWLESMTVPEGETLIYCDPPYLMSTRSSQRRIYQCELCDDQHVRLLDILKRLPYSIAISGYPSEMYDNALIGWRRITFAAQTRGGSSAVEVLWMNYPIPVELHDYRYLGGDFRERERIKRRQARWRQRLRTMPIQERYAMLSVIGELRTIDSPADCSDADMPLLLF